MYKAARDVHTNGIHNTFTSKGRGKMNHIKQFFREKGLYLFCLAMVFAATAAGILALRTVVSNVADLTRTRKEALQNDSAWTQPDTAIDKPAQADDHTRRNGKALSHPCACCSTGPEGHCSAAGTDRHQTRYLGREAAGGVQRQ